jgi:hypothetical protein
MLSPARGEGVGYASREMTEGRIVWKMRRYAPRSFTTFRMTGWEVLRIIRFHLVILSEAIA